MINKLINAAGSLDEKGFKREADYLDGIIRKLAEGEAAVNKKTDTWIAVHDPVYDSKGKVPGWLRNETLRTLIEDAVSNRPEVGRLRLQLLSLFELEDLLILCAFFIVVHFRILKRGSFSNCKTRVLFLAIFEF